MATGFTPQPNSNPLQSPRTPNTGGVPYPTNSPQYMQAGGSYDPFEAAKNAYLQNSQPQLDAIRQQQGLSFGQGAMQQQLYGNNAQGLNLDFQSNMNDLNTNVDVNGMQRARQLADAAAYGRMMGYNTDVFNAQGENLGNSAAKNLADLNSTATANGAFTASGTNKNRHFNAVDFFSNYKALEGNYKQQQESLGMRQGNALSQSDILAREAQNLGTKPALLQAQLDNGLAKLGLQNAISTADLLKGIASGNQQAAAIYAQILGSAGAYAQAYKQGG